MTTTVYIPVFTSSHCLFHGISSHTDMVYITNHLNPQQHKKCVGLIRHSNKSPPDSRKWISTAGHASLHYDSLAGTKQRSRVKRKANGSTTYMSSSCIYVCSCF